MIVSGCNNVRVREKAMINFIFFLVYVVLDGNQYLLPKSLAVCCFLWNLVPLQRKGHENALHWSFQPMMTKSLSITKLCSLNSIYLLEAMVLVKINSLGIWFALWLRMSMRMHSQVTSAAVGILECKNKVALHFSWLDLDAGMLELGRKQWFILVFLN